MDEQIQPQTIDSGSDRPDVSARPETIGETEEKLTPRQIDFLRFYNDPTSETFGNALQSALRAGYSQEYSESITAQMPEWFSENIGRRKRLLSKAENVLEDSLAWEEKNLKLDSAKFIAKTLGKNDGYSERTELTGKDGSPISLMPYERAKSIIQGAGKRSDTGDLPK